ncbi:MAG TPA: signal peptidase I, partial [Candidatus Polarisedimenticolia bacterium]|nr:signal peptidase I [Candidatus Polarisedimenticolia bacterium]
GETIEVRDRQVYIDGKPIDEPYKIHRLPKEVNFEQNDYRPTRIPENSLFCMGDNRDNSKDSRAWGFVPRDYVKGRAFMIWWSYEEDSTAWQRTGFIEKIQGMWEKITHFFTKSRWERSFQIIK